MYTRLYNFFELFGLLSPCQFGFRNMHSTIDALVESIAFPRNGGKYNMEYHKGLYYAPPLFLNYINDLPIHCKHAQVLLFADDTNLTFLNKSCEEVQREIDNVKHWLDTFKLCLNIDKTIQLNLKSSENRFDIDNKYISIEPVCKYLGILVDFKFSFVSHLSVLKSRLSKQCGIISKLRH